MKTQFLSWHSRLFTSIGMGGITLLALVLFGYEFGSQPSMVDMAVAGGLGAAIGWVATLVV